MRKNIFYGWVGVRFVTARYGKNYHGEVRLGVVGSGSSSVG